MIRRVLLIWFLASVAFAETEVIDYLIPEEVMGVYQSPNLLKQDVNSLGVIDRVVLAMVANRDVELRPKVMPAHRARFYSRTTLGLKWISYSFSGGTMSARVAGTPAEDWMRSGKYGSFHLANFRTYFWYLDKPGHNPKSRRDLRGKSVGILNSAGYEPMRQWRDELDINVVKAKSIASVMKMLVSDRLDFVFLSKGSTRWHYDRMGLDPRLLHQVYAPDMSIDTEIHITWSNSISDKLQSHFMTTLQKMDSSGELEDIRRHYHLDPS